VPKFDLVQVHNLLAWKPHLQTLFQMKAAGAVRYVGITTSEGRRHDLLEQIMRSEPIDFVQFSYNVVDREAEARLLPLASERGIAVIVNRPFRQGALTRSAQAREGALNGLRTRRVKLGAAHAEIHPRSPAVTVAIPGDHPRRPLCAKTSRPPPARCLIQSMRSASRATRRRSDVGVVDLPAEDFLLFSPRVYWRMFELHKRRLWPLHVLTLAAGLIIILLIAWRPELGTLARTHPRDALDLRRVVLPVESLRDHQLGCRLCRAGFRR
jgi:hypothetical protein